MVFSSVCLWSGPMPKTTVKPAFPCVSLQLPQALGPHHLPEASCPVVQHTGGRRRRALPQPGRAKGKNQGSDGQGWLSREGSQLGGGWVGIRTKPHCQFNMMPLTYFPVGKHSGYACNVHRAPKRDAGLLSPCALSRFTPPGSSRSLL